MDSIITRSTLVNTPVKEDPRALISRAIFNKFHPIKYNHQVYIYDDSLHHYIEDCDHISSEATQNLYAIGSYLFRKEILMECLATAELNNKGSIFPFNPRNDLINCKNGVVKITSDGLKLIPHSHEYLFNYCIESNFNEKYLGSTPDLDALLNEWGDPSFVIDACALSLCQLRLKDTYKHAFIVEGSGDAGKTTFLELVSTTFGSCSYVNLRSLSENVFALSSLEGKLFNLGDEAPQFTINTTENLKCLTGSVRQGIEGKYKNHRDGIITAILIFACNDLPDVSKIHDIAFFGRWRIAEFKNKFKRDPFKKQEILSQKMREQLLMKSLLRSEEIIKNGWDGEPNPDINEALWKSRSAGTDRYIFEALVSSENYNETIPLDLLYDDYCSWCKLQTKNRSITPIMSKRALSSRVSFRGHGHKMKDGYKVFTGIAFKSPFREWLNYE